MKTPKNIAASVRQRLLNRSREDNRSFNERLQYYGMERFLYRLSVSRDLYVTFILNVWCHFHLRLTPFSPRGCQDDHI